MKRISALLIAAMILIPGVMAMKSVNSRLVITEDDFAAEGSGTRYKQMDSLLTELATILPATGTRPVDAIDVDSIRGNPDIDSIAGLDVLRGNPDVDSLSGEIVIDSLLAGQDAGIVINDTVAIVLGLQVGGGSVIDSMSILDDTNDTLFISIGAKTWKFTPTGDL